MRLVYSFSAIALLSTACATMNESLQFGAGMGLATGVAATYAGYSAVGASPTFENVAAGAGIGLTVGLLTSYLTHKKVEEDRQACQAEQTEIHFGDLPPSPFVVPKMTPKKGGR